MSAAAEFARAVTASSPRQTSWPVWLLLAAALLTAGALRLTLLEQKCLWPDELASLRRQGLPLAEHVRAMKGNHPLYELLMRSWGEASSKPDAWLRLPSALLGVAAVWLTWALLRSNGRAAALLGAWLMALSPLHIMFSRIARPYSLACVLALLSNLALVRAVRRPTFLRLAAYVVATALMIHANLFSCALWVSQGVFVVWFYRKRIHTAMRWILVHAYVGALILPWMASNAPSAVRWSQGTHYTPQQLGRLYKAANLALALCVGETVHPLNFKIVLPAFAAFGLAMALGVVFALRRRRGVAAFFLIQVLVTLPIAIFFGAASPKHLTILLPAWLGLMALGLARARWKIVAVILLAGMVATMSLSTANYFMNREFTDADMVTPWKAMGQAVNARRANTDPVIVGYRPDPDAYRLFTRYFEAKDLPKPERLDFDAWRGHLARAARRPGVKQVILLLHDGDPWREIERWMTRRGWAFDMQPWQEEEHTIEALRAWRAARSDFASDRLWLRALPTYLARSRSPLYRLYVIALSADPGAEP